MHAHILIEQVFALQENFDAVRSDFLDKISRLDIHQGVTGSSCFQFRHAVLAHHVGSTHVGCPRAHPVIQFHSEPEWRDPRHIASMIQFSANIVGKQPQIDGIRLEGEDRFSLGAVESRVGLRKILYQEFAIGVQRAGIVGAICGRHRRSRRHCGQKCNCRSSYERS